MMQTLASAGNKTKVVHVRLREYLKDFGELNDIVVALGLSQPC
jgi:hypothetical protein